MDRIIACRSSCFFFFQAEDGIRDLVRSRGLGDVYKRQLLHHVTGLSGIGGTERPGIVHRLDRGTSGVMVVAKHDRAHRALSAQFHDRLCVSPSLMYLLLLSLLSAPFSIDFFFTFFQKVSLLYTNPK